MSQFNLKKISFSKRDHSQLRLNPRRAWTILLLLFIIAIAIIFVWLYRLMIMLGKIETTNAIATEVNELETAGAREWQDIESYLTTRAATYQKYQTEKPLLVDPSM